MTDAAAALDAGFVLDFLERIRPVIQNAERAALARLQSNEAAANNYELRLFGACVELGEQLRDEIRRVVQEEIQKLSSASRPSEDASLDTSVEPHTVGLGDEVEMKMGSRTDVGAQLQPEKSE